MSTFVAPIVGQHKPDNNQEQEQNVRSGVKLLAFEKG